MSTEHENAERKGKTYNQLVYEAADAAIRKANATVPGEAGTAAIITSEEELLSVLDQVGDETRPFDADPVARLAATIRSAQVEIRKLRAVVEKQREALERIVVQQKAEGFEGCFDCDCPDQCSHKSGCATLAGMGWPKTQEIAAAALAAGPGESEAKREG